MSAELRNRYLTVWQQVLCGWLDWPAERFNDFASRWEVSLRGDSQADLFYHYDELHYILQFLVPAQRNSENT